MMLPLILLLGAAAPLDLGTMLRTPITLPELEAEATKGFRAMDPDNDGFVTFDDIIKAARATVEKAGLPGDLPEEALRIPRKIFDDGDPNHDGRISLAEQLAGVDREFASSDTNHDGIVTANERSASMEGALQHLLDVTGPAAKVSAKAAAPTDSATRLADLRRRMDDLRRQMNEGRTLAQNEQRDLKGFRLEDLDHDGFVTEAELVKYMQTILGNRPVAAESAHLDFEKRDTNHDGRISIDEDRQNTMRQFASDDANHDGVITLQEGMDNLRSTLAETELSDREGFRLQDLDHDGFITMAEMTKFMQQGLGNNPTLAAMPAMQAIARVNFEGRDRNHDGRISIDEDRRNTIEKFRADDLNHDGVVTVKEGTTGLDRKSQARGEALIAAMKTSCMDGKSVSPGKPVVVCKNPAK